MKKVIFLQLNGKSYGGVWQVNKTVGEALINKGYDVSVVSLRDNRNDEVVQHDERLKLRTINEKDLWSTYHFTEMKSVLKKGKVIEFTKMAISRIKHDWILNKDIKTLQEYIRQQKPDYIVNTHYQLLDMIPEEYLKVTIHEQHSDFSSAYEHKATRETLKKYNGKIKFLWLTKATMQDAISEGFQNNYYIYNAVRFETESSADVINNKKLVTICRLSEQKNISLMIEIAEKIFQDNKFKGWVLEIYGDGELKTKLEEKIQNKKQIKLMGKTNDPKDVLLTSSINLNTSLFEGFAMSILEANECGVPTVSLVFGESVYEQIINGKTGIICKGKDDYIKKLAELMNDNNELLDLSRNCKAYSSDYHIDKIIAKWLDLLK